MIALLQKSNIDIPTTSHRSSSSSSSCQSDGNDIGKGHALCAFATPPASTWLLDLGASHHMASSQDLFSSFEASPTPHILMGNNTTMTICGKGSIDIDDGTFHNVLCVPSLSSNLLSIYQITHSGTRKIVEFSHDLVHIKDSETCCIVSIGTVDHSSHLYSFTHFGPPSPLSENCSPSL